MDMQEFFEYRSGVEKSKSAHLWIPSCRNIGFHEKN